MKLQSHLLHYSTLWVICQEKIQHGGEIRLEMARDEKVDAGARRADYESLKALVGMATDWDPDGVYAAPAPWRRGGLVDKSLQVRNPMV